MTMTAAALPDVTGSDTALRRFLHGLPGVDQVGADGRAANLATRSIKTTAKAWAIDLAISMIDLATLEGADTQGSATGRAADALAANALDSAVQRRVPTNPISRGVDALSRGALNLYGSDLSAADDQFQRGATSPDAYDARGLTWRERLQSSLLPKRSSTDVVLTDRNGRNVSVGADTLGDLTPEEYNRRALLRRSTVE